jgi:hypothetical protein
MNAPLDCCHTNLTESSRVDSILTHKLQIETLSLTRLDSTELDSVGVQTPLTFRAWFLPQISSSLTLKSLYFAHIVHYIPRNVLAMKENYFPEFGDVSFLMAAQSIVL